MDRARLVVLLAAVLAVVVVAMAAATVPNTVETGGGSGPGEGEGVETPRETDLDEQSTPWFVYLLAALLVGFVALAVVGMVLYPRDALREFVRTVVASALVLAAFWVVLQLLERSGGSRPPGGNVSGSGGGAGGGSGESVGSGGDQLVTTLSPEVIGVAVVLGLLLVVGLAAVVADRRRGSDEPDPSAATGPDRLSALGRSAGRLADRMAATESTDNDVYRAWKEMTDHLELDDPDVRTPGEFRTAAVAAGMAREDVDALTQLFEDVRYGGSPPSSERERRAVETLRRIERRYTEVGDG